MPPVATIEPFVGSAGLLHFKAIIRVDHCNLLDGHDALPQKMI
jgi:hypothetical protein